MELRAAEQPETATLTEATQAHKSQSSLQLPPAKKPNEVKLGTFQMKNMNFYI